MGTLTLTFNGICVHMTRLNPFRVVVPSFHADGERYTLAPTLTIGETVLPLTGQTIFIGRPHAEATASLDLECTPHLSLVAPSMILSESVAFERQAPAAAYFDIFEGKVTLIPSVPGRTAVAYAQLELEVDSDEAAEIRIQNWSDGSVETIQVALTDLFVMSNVPSPAAGFNDPEEYLLNLLVAANFDRLRDPLQLELIRIALDMMIICLGLRFRRDADDDSALPTASYFETFPSCSNSQWP